MNLPLYSMIRTLRSSEEVILYARLLRISAEDEAATLEFLQSEYASESREYPGEAPAFDAAAARWAAHTLYIAAQVLLYREHKSADLPVLLPAYNGNTDAAALLSADLCLRFLPDVLQQLQLIDPLDPLNSLLLTHLQHWHYSGLVLHEAPADADLQPVLQNPCLKQLYINRIISCRRTKTALLPGLEPAVRNALGIYEDVFWPGFNTRTEL